MYFILYDFLNCQTEIYTQQFIFYFISCESDIENSILCSDESGY